MTDGETLRLGIDLGTSAVKAVVIDADGAVVATGEAAFATRTDLPGQAEQAPRDWLLAVAEAVASLGNRRRRVAGIGLAGQLPTLVCLGEREPLGPAIAWSDSRADAWAAGALDERRRDELYRRTGMPIDGRYLAPMFHFHWRTRCAAVRRILSAKDYLCYALTGRAVTDPSTAAGYGVHSLDGGWDPDLAAFWELDPSLLPALLPAESSAGGLTVEAARLLDLPQGVPVAVGAADSVAGALAMAGVEEGVVSLVMGSSAVVIDAVPGPRLDPERRYLLTPHVRPRWFGREMDLLAAGTGYRWLGRLLGWSGTEMEARAAAAPPGARGLFFAPYLAGGEQGALWNPALTGVLHGLSLHHGPADVARAFLEGVQFEIRRCVEVLAERGPVRRIVLAGHMAASPPMLQMLADILGRPVDAFAHLSPAALGAALLAPAPGAAARATPDPGHGSARPGPVTDEYDALYRRYAALFPRAALPPATA